MHFGGTRKSKEGLSTSLTCSLFFGRLLRLNIEGGADGEDLTMPSILPTSTEARARCSLKGYHRPVTLQALVVRFMAAGAPPSSGDDVITQSPRVTALVLLKQAALLSIVLYGRGAKRLVRVPEINYGAGRGKKLQYTPDLWERGEDE